MSSVLKATLDSKTTSVTTYFKKLTTGDKVFIVPVIVLSNCHILQFLNQMLNVSALLLDDALKPETSLNNGVINKTLRQFDIAQGSVATHLRCGGIFTDSIITNILLLLIVK